MVISFNHLWKKFTHLENVVYGYFLFVNCTVFSKVDLNVLSEN